MCFSGIGKPLPGSASTLVHISRAAAVNYLPTPFFLFYCVPSFLYLISFVVLSLFVDQFLHFIISLASLPPVSNTTFSFCHLFRLTCLIFHLLYFSHRIIFLPLSRIFSSFFPYSSNNFFFIFILSAIFDFIFSCFYIFLLPFYVSVILPL